jgi:hypothetical protein
MREAAAIGRSNDDALGIGLVLAVAIGTVVLAHVVPEAPRNTIPSTSASFERDAGCTEWTDGCQICMRTAQGSSCSTAGFACVREAPRCTRR